MINGLEGIPGSGKSYEAVVFHVLTALKRGRKVITNLPLKPELFGALNPEYLDLIEVRIRPAAVLGTFDANRVDDKGQGEAFRLWLPGEESFVDQGPRLVAGPHGSTRVILRSGSSQVFGNVWDYYSEWKDEDGRGPLFIIDECHKAMPKIGTDQEVIDWYKLHRHFNCDVLLATQNFRHMAQDIADLMAMVIKVRKADVLGKPKSYIRKVHAGYRGAVISDEIRDYQPQYFPLYKSHTQGNSVAELGADDVKPLYLKFRRFTWGFWIFALLVCAYVFWPSSKKPLTLAVATPKPSTAPAPSKPDNAPSAPQPEPVAQAPQPPDLEPLKDKLIHITGWMRAKGFSVASFTVSVGGVRQFDVLSSDLQRSGYTWEPMGECIGYLRWMGKTRTVLCDAPVLLVGTNSTPVVMNTTTGGRSDAVRLN